MKHCLCDPWARRWAMPLLVLLWACTSTSCVQEVGCSPVRYPDGTFVRWEHPGLSAPYDITVQFDDVSATLTCDPRELDGPELYDGELADEVVSESRCTSSDFYLEARPERISVVATNYRFVGTFEGYPKDLDYSGTALDEPCHEGELPPQELFLEVVSSFE